MHKREVTVGLVGYGYWGPNLARNMFEIDDARLKYICDSTPENLEKAGAACPGVMLTDDFDRIMTDGEVEAVVIASPAATHYPLCRKALTAGKHVFVEKPLSTEVEQGRDLVRLASERDLVLMVGHIFLHHPGVRFIKEFIDSGQAGKILYMYSQRLNLGRLRRDENCLWSLAPHDVSIMLHLLDEMPVSVVARGASYLRTGIEDVAFFTLDFPGGQIGNVHVSWLDPHKIRKFTIVGTEKMLVFDLMEPENKVKVFDKRVYPVLKEEVMGYGDEMKIHFGEETCPEIDLEEPLALECLHFLECVRDGREPLASGESGVRVIEVIEAACRSMEEERPISIGRGG